MTESDEYWCLIAGNYRQELECAKADNERLRAGNARIGTWMAAALDDPNVCQEMKHDIEVWFRLWDVSPGGDNPECDRSLTSAKREAD